MKPSARWDFICLCVWLFTWCHKSSKLWVSQERAALEGLKSPTARARALGEHDHLAGAHSRVRADQLVAQLVHGGPRLGAALPVDHKLSSERPRDAKNRNEHDLALGDEEQRVPLLRRRNKGQDFEGDSLE